jgi:uncharacterized repeat protein (TIGR03803 family)
MKRLCIAVVALTLLPVAAGAATEQVLWSFGDKKPDGRYPTGGLISVNGTLYGTTDYGGEGSHHRECQQKTTCGIVFSLDPETGMEKVQWLFGNGADGSNPEAGLISLEGMLYGTTTHGGQSHYGTAFSLNPGTGAETVVYSFCSQQNCTDGSSPPANLISVKETLYGTTPDGGQYGYGTVFSLDPTTGTEKVLWSFGNGADGQYPEAGLISVKGMLYGTTELGGQYSDGAVFSLDPTTGKEKVLWSFGNGTDGRYPEADLISVGGTLYGTTYAGGQYNCPDTSCGTVFSFDPRTIAEKVLWSFGNGIDGWNPAAGLVFVDGTLYGTTYYGGDNCLSAGCGIVFSLDPTTDTETVLWSFGSGTDGKSPGGGLISVNGTLYGTTEFGGAHGRGTVFSLTP